MDFFFFFFLFRSEIATNCNFQRSNDRSINSTNARFDFRTIRWNDKMTRLIDVKSFGTKSVGFEIELFQISVPRKIKTRGMYKAYPFDIHRHNRITKTIDHVRRKFEYIFDSDPLFPSLSPRYVISQSRRNNRDLCRIQRTNFPSVRILPSAPHCYAISRLEATREFPPPLSYLC